MSKFDDLRNVGRSGILPRSASQGPLPIVFMFSGQGSQYYGMGKELFDENEVFRQTMEHFDAALVDSFGDSVLAKIFDPTKQKSDLLHDTKVTHPAIVMIELALTKTLMSMGIRPDYLLGASLGEYTAAVVSGCIDPLECLRLLARQATDLRAGPRGGMLAVLAGLEVLESVPALRSCEIAARNYPGHFIVAGTQRALESAESALRAADILHQRVPVEYGYHSYLMDEVLTLCRRDLSTIRFDPPQIPWVSCVDGLLVKRASADHFWRVARRPIEFETAMSRMQVRGDFLYLDLGPSGTLHNFVRNNLSPGTKSQSAALLNPFGYDSKVLSKIFELAAPKVFRKVHNMKVYGFPGQGAQRRGMGKDLFQKYSEYTAIADRVLGYSIEALCVSDPERQLGQTRYTQPALYVVEVLTYLDRMAQDQIPADYLVGHSLGEYVALFAAEVFDFETGLRLVKRRGELMSEADGGSMAAVIGVDEDTILGVLRGAGLDGIDLANYNSLDQFVISGPGDQLDAAGVKFAEAGMRAVRLNVSAPFHSRYMQGTADEFRTFLEGFSLSSPKIPILANVDAQPYTLDKLKETLVAQIASPVRWTEIVRRLMGYGDFEFIELGPTKVLTKLVQKIRAGSSPLRSPSSVSNLLADSGGAHKNGIDSARTSKPVLVAGHPESLRIASHQVTRSPASLEARTDDGAREGEGVETLSSPERRRSSPVSTIDGSRFCDRYGVRRPYVAGGLHYGVSSVATVRRMAEAGLLGFIGSGGLSESDLDQSLGELKGQLKEGSIFGVSLIHDPVTEREWARVQCCLTHKVRVLETIGFTRITPALVWYRAKGLSERGGRVHIEHRIIARASRPETAQHFLLPAPAAIVRRLIAGDQITQREAELLARVPMADDLCAQSDSGGLTDHGLSYAVIPALRAAREEYSKKYDYPEPIGLGASGGLGNPEAISAAFLLGAEFVVSGTINQCTVEAGTSDTVKNMLGKADIHDTDYAPAVDAFELGGKVQILKRGVFYPARANRLYRLYLQHDNLEQIDRGIAAEIQDSYLRCSFDQAIEQSCARFLSQDSSSARNGSDPKRSMALAFRWYLERAARCAIAGLPDEQVNYQVPCSPAVGALNRWVQGTELADWRTRHVDELGLLLLDEATEYLRRRARVFFPYNSSASNIRNLI